ncbi:MAG: hypothetical protein [Olavius algarvensis Gamma 3 endosymbiont]|nr:MAG: hypothetical protein [Olavius algarvensis Gamma 3 endosymbiont]
MRWLYLPAAGLDFASVYRRRTRLLQIDWRMQSMITIHDIFAAE